MTWCLPSLASRKVFFNNFTLYLLGSIFKLIFLTHLIDIFLIQVSEKDRIRIFAIFYLKDQGFKSGEQCKFIVIRLRRHTTLTDLLLFPMTLNILINSLFFVFFIYYLGHIKEPCVMWLVKRKVSKRKVTKAYAYYFIIFCFLYLLPSLQKNTYVLSGS